MQTIYLFCMMPDLARRMHRVLVCLNHKKVGRSHDDFETFSKSPILRAFRHLEENRLSDFWACFILCFVTTCCANRINIVVVLYLLGIETFIFVPPSELKFSLYCTYEELKLSSTISITIVFASVVLYLWGIETNFVFSLQPFPASLLYCTYEELKLYITLKHNLSYFVVLYLRGIETNCPIRPIMSKCSCTVPIGGYWRTKCKHDIGNDFFYQGKMKQKWMD